jgi:hypothetical protein
VVRYAAQPYKYSCGPTAIINAVKWTGARFTLRQNHTFISRLCESTYEFGTVEHLFERALRKIISPAAGVWRRPRPSAKEIIRHVSRPDGAVVLLYWHRKMLSETEFVIEGHYILVVDAWNDHALLVNDDGPVAQSPVTFEEFKRRAEFLRSSVAERPIAWFLRKL